MLDDALKRYLDGHFDRHLDELKDFVRFRSISAQSEHIGDCRACADWLAEMLNDLHVPCRVETSLGRPAVIGSTAHKPDRPTLLIYGHYDVQPPEPLELWETEPFDPVERDGFLYGRGSSDDKGQLLPWIKAAEALRAVHGDLPVNLKVLIEGEEEAGSPSLEHYVAAHTDELACDTVAISDTHWFDETTPSVTYGLRGLAYIEVCLTGPNRDLHSGGFGGAVTNPLNALAGMIGRLHDEKGRVTLEGFYDDVVPLSQAERDAWQALGENEQALCADLGVEALAGGEVEYTPLERRWARPTLDCNGIWGGYTGEGTKTVLPSWARAKLSCRLVGDQDPEKILDAIRRYFTAGAPAGTTAAVEVLSCDEPWLMPVDSPALAVAKAAMEEAFQTECTLIRGGGTVPITAMFHKHLGVHSLMMGLGADGDRIHSPNERMSIARYRHGIAAAASLMLRLGKKG